MPEYNRLEDKFLDIVLTNYKERMTVSYRHDLLVGLLSCKLLHRKKLSHFDLKNWVTGGTKIRYDVPNNWRIFESNWLDIESQIDSILRVKLTRYWESIWLDIENQIASIFRVKLNRYLESNWIDIESQIESILSVKLTWYWESNWLDFESQFDSNILQLLGILDRI